MTQERATHLVPEQKCPHCGQRLNAVMPSDAADKDQPKFGDVTLCVSCLRVLVFMPNLSVRILSSAELAAMDAETRLQLARARSMLRRQRGTQ